MLHKILIANRGEIACRIMRTAQRLGVATVAVYSDADRDTLHVAMADEAVHIGASPSTESYLRGDRIIAAAKATGAEAVHPGYGFLAENADFADACKVAGITFIGPSGDAMRRLGGKAAAKAVAREASVPVVPGYDGASQDAALLQREAGRIGYPVMIKAVAGGGGRGMRLVEGADSFVAALESAQREALSSFGNATVLIEKVVQRPRHIEVQVFGDRHGNVVHLFERDCSLQRRNQKVIEEAPAPGMSEALRQKMCTAATRLARAVGYEGAGTVEFLVEGGSLGADAPWYFIEMNTRLQVEHPVTEEITGLDLVEWQLRVASGEPLPLTQDAIRLEGHAIEVRLCAEDPAQGFLPSIGRVAAFALPEGTGARFETAIRAGDVISPFYDSMIAKLITHAATRDEAADAMVAALRRLEVAGPRVNTAFLCALLEHADVRALRMDTGLIGRDIADLARSRIGTAEILAAAQRLLAPAVDKGGPWSAGDGFQLGQARALAVPLVVNGEARTFSATWSGSGAAARIAIAGDMATAAEAPDACIDVAGGLYALWGGEQVEVAWPAYDADDIDDGQAGDAVRAPINGKVARVFVKAGDIIAKGDRLAVVEAMKMEHVLNAVRDGVVAGVSVSEGQQVNQGALLVSLEPVLQSAEATS
ncbi:MAG: acetyl/propionyl/methylcrotonyl-CoA carboxylase subunit alpha [Hyphomicrobiaceae bacterium]